MNPQTTCIEHLLDDRKSSEYLFLIQGKALAGTAVTCSSFIVKAGYARQYDTAAIARCEESWTSIRWFVNMGALSRFEDDLRVGARTPAVGPAKKPVYRGCTQARLSLHALTPGESG
jgi:hypothetical protein